MELPSVPNLTVAGLNEFRFADGYDISSDVPRPWNYLINTADLRVGIHGLYLKTQFEVQEPSMGYNPPGDPVYREHFSRRTIGFEMDPFTIEAGHVSTQFGRGLTLSCKEDRDIERYSLLDGVYGQVRFPRATLQGIAGRPFQQRNSPVALLSADEDDDDFPDTLLIANEADMHFRDLIAGVYGEAFLPVEKAPFSFLSSGSIGGGIVRYGSEVGPVSSVYRDGEPFWYQNRKEMYLPSVATNLAISDYGLSFEHAWMTGRIHSHSMDSVRGAFDSLRTTPNGTSTYISANALLFGVSFLAEYKNYHYERSKEYSEEIGAFLIPPIVRYQHSWHLLNKHALSNLMGDALGYKFMVNWAPSGSALLTADFTYGGSHDDKSRFTIRPNSAYWEAYAEWAQEAGERINYKVGFDYGMIDPERHKVTYRTLACNVNAGPFNRRHSFGLTLEGQLNDKPFLAEKNGAALRELITRVVPADSLQLYITPSTGDTVPADTLYDQLDLLVPDKYRSRYRQFAFNLLATLSYSFSPWLSMAVTLEHEVLLDDQDYIHLITDITSKENNYASLGVVLKPFPNHTVTIEYGSMSGGKKCTLGTCVDVPPFKGFKLTVTSML